MDRFDFDFMDFFICNRKQCKEKIIEIIQENKDKSITVAINGKWGVGKSYFWKNEIAPLLEKEFNKYPLYTSVFGKNNEQDIIQDLVAQFLKKTNAKLETMKNISSIVTNAFGVKVDIGFIFDLFEEKDLHNTIVCIDDFERLSDKIPLEDILGLICELKENKGCSVIVLYNEDELFKVDESDQKNNQNKSEQTRNKKIFEKYKEKVFDLQIKFAPSTTEQFSILSPTSLDTNFNSYQYLSDILSIEKLLQSHSFINLRELDRVNRTYQLLLNHFSLREYPSEEFKKTYNYLLYPIAYAYHFGLNQEYFKQNSTRSLAELTSPHTCMYGNLLKILLSDLKYGLKSIQKTGFLFMPQLLPDPKGYTPIQRCILRLYNFVAKVIDDTIFHQEYLLELEKASNNADEASINFFLKHKDNMEALPYLFGYRILNYGKEGEEALIYHNFASRLSFSFQVVMQQYREDYLKLFNKWCDKAWDEYFCPEVQESNQTNESFFWINNLTFYTPLQYTFEKLNIPMPQNKLIASFQRS